MRVYLLVVASTLLGGCAWLQTIGVWPQPAPGSFSARADAVTADVMLSPASAETFSARCDQAHQLVVEMRDELADRTGPAGRADLKDFDALRRVLVGIGFGEGGLVAETHPDAAIRAAGDACQKKMSDLESNIALSRPVYKRLSGIDRSGLSSRDAYLLDRVLENFRRSGVDRDAATRERIEQVQSELTDLSLQWGKTLRESQRQLELSSARELAGLPPDYIAAHPANDDGQIVITTAYPDVFPILNYADSSTLRHDVLAMFRNRAYPENVPTLRQLLEKRYEYAGLLGFDSWAHYALSNKMVGSPGKAQDFLDRLETAARPAAEIEYQRLLDKLRERRPRAAAVPEWSSSYVQEQIKQSDYALDSQQVREYFAYDNVRDGIITLVEDLFNVQIRPWQQATVWHDSVTAHALYQNDQLIGRFFLDMHPRDGKFNHAAAFPVRLGPTSSGVPMATLVCNFPQGGHKTGLMEHSQVETFLHEFGHLIHMLFSAQPDYQELAMHELEWDFIEAPSQMLEEWVWDYDTLAKFAVNAEGEPIPRQLVDKMVAARYFGLGVGTLRQLTYANVSLNYYNRPPDQVDFKAMWDAMETRFSLFERLPDAHSYASFGHLDGYSAYYYTYQWSLAIATDMFSQFEASGLRDAATSQRYRETVLAPGSSRPAADLVEEFLGRQWSLDAYEQLLREAAQPR